MKKVFIDGSAGTTGLRINERLGARNDIELLTLSEKLRKDVKARREIMNDADIVFLCLPDDAAREAVLLIENPETVIIDTSTAHRTADSWVYGFPELSVDLEKAVSASKRISVPGCHASGFTALVKPLVDSGFIEKDSLLVCQSLTGFSGGGKKMIADYSADSRSLLLDAPRIYGLSCEHKHLKEMKAVTGLDVAPLFSPIVADFYSGMLVTVPLFSEWLCNGVNAEIIKETYREKYHGPIVKYVENNDEAGFLSAGKMSGKDSMEISVFGNEEKILLTARYDNLGKGASGAAVECMNIKLGTNLTDGLIL